MDQDDMKYEGHTIVEGRPRLVGIQGHQPRGRALSLSQTLKRLLFLSSLIITNPGTAEYTPSDNVQEDHRYNVQDMNCPPDMLFTQCTRRVIELPFTRCRIKPSTQ